ncbi:hypothetical protein FMM08_11850 [Quadrisphaera setariae]|uniref:Uncharacterized protein n=1 Tax=Quadrisphaera setariae TaxID=2593304 RepID=A0A5C8ZE83_9ACTN|nr:hypothetical protein FMM08_11850 [Quadrisphaera setariae]
MPPRGAKTPSRSSTRPIRASSRASRGPTHPIGPAPVRAAAARSGAGPVVVGVVGSALTRRACARRGRPGGAPRRPRRR